MKNLFGKIKDLPDDDIELKAHWAKYLCVLSAGFIENSLVEVFYAYCTKTANGKVASFTRKALFQIHNPNTEKLIEITNSFDKNWGDTLRTFIEDEGRNEGINAIMSHRHRIAHGKGSDITYHRLQGYFVKSVEVIEFIENLVA